MASSDRPSGLTALAVIQFLFGVGQFFEVLSLTLLRFVFGPAELERAGGRRRGPSAEELEYLRELIEVPLPSFSLLLGLLLLSCLLFLLTGLGLLRRKRWLGRHASTLFVLVEFGALATALLLFPESYLRELGIGLIRMIFYPLFLLACVHLVFRRDLVN